MVWLLEELHINYDVEIFHREKTMLAPSGLSKLHPLGHSPLVTVTPPAQPGLPEDEEKRRVVLAETSFIAERLIDYFPEHGKKLVPSKKWKDGLEGVPGGETEDWMRYQYYMQYVEGSFMPILVLALIIGRMSRLSLLKAPFLLTFYHCRFKIHRCPILRPSNYINRRRSHRQHVHLPQRQEEPRLS